MSNNYAPSFPVARLFRKTSKEGKTYFVGRLGGARLAVIKSNETAEDGGEIWHLMISEAQKPKAPPEGNNPAPYSTVGADPEAARRDWQKPSGGQSFGDEQIPFAAEVR
jgi:hypothetical protein